MNTRQFLEAAWDEHAERSEEVAARIGSSLGLIESAEQVPGFVQLLVHVYGEHLGRWQRGTELLQSMKPLAVLGGSAAAHAAVDRGVATLRYAGGEGGALEALPAEDRVRALAAASAALAGRDDFTRAIAAFREALRLGEADWPAGSPAIRALAVTGNNLAVALEGKRDRSRPETEAMVGAAEAALTCWKRAGTWLEKERAEYRLARSLLEAGEPALAVACAERCLQVCEEHDAPPFERVFAHALVALAHGAAGDAARSRSHRDAAKRWHEQVPAAERQSCESDLEALGG
ncbi:MAG: hypothetical protein ABIQ33_04860 [Caldimonas sp.]